MRQKKRGLRAIIGAKLRAFILKVYGKKLTGMQAQGENRPEGRHHSPLNCRIPTEILRVTTTGQKVP